MKNRITLSLALLLIAGAAQAEPVTRTSTFDGPKASSTKTTVADKDAGTFSVDRTTTRKSDGAVATVERDRERTDTGVSGSGTRTGFNGKTATYEYERTQTDNGWQTSGSGTGPNGGHYDYSGSGTKTDNGREAERSLSRGGNEVWRRNDVVTRSGGTVTRDTSVTRKQRRRNR